MHKYLVFTSLYHIKLKFNIKCSREFSVPDELKCQLNSFGFMAIEQFLEK